MSIGTRVRMGVLALLLLSTFAVAPGSDAAKSPCDECGATCWMEYQAGWADCSGAPAGCLRTTVCP